jgi:NAD(P)-dependent dehydrogenase (short-subunit alcohol dehydrogenase family)
MSTVLITGANRGLGLEFARQYAGAGWRVIATCRDLSKAQALEAIAAHADVHELDVRDAAAVMALGARLERVSVDVLIANAGVMTAPPDAPPEAVSRDAWLEAFEVNAVAPLACACAFLRQVARSSERKMIAVGSRIGSVTANVAGGHYVYRASKSALNALWRSFALDHPEIIAAVLSPGALQTDMTRYHAERWAGLPEPAEAIARLRALIAGLGQDDSGGFFHVTGERLPW